MSGNNIFSDTFIAFNLRCDVVLPGMNADRAKILLQKIKNEVSQIELTVGRFEAPSELMQINNSPKNEWIPVSDIFLEFLIISADFYNMSNGAFDCTLAPLSQALKNTETLSDNELSEIKKKCGFDKIEIDEDNKQCRFLTDGMQFDFGALEKAYVLDVLKDLLLKESVSSAIISFEEECVLAIGTHPNGDAWPVGIRHMDLPNEFIHVFPLNNQTVVIAGTEYLDLETGTINKRSIISPENGLPVSGRKTVSVKSDSALLAAFVAYTWLILPENDKSIIADQLKNVEIFECEYLADDVSTKLTLIGREDDDE